MAISSIHFAPGKGGYFAHNSREAKTNNSIFNDEENYCSASSLEALKMYREELRKRSEAYQKRTGQKIQKNATTHLSAIFNFNRDTTPEQAHKVCEYLEKTLDTKVVQMSMHRDEGHIIEEESKAIHDKIKIDTAIKNYHGHIEMLGIDSQGNSIRRKLDKPMLREIQTEVAKILQMERGRHTSYNKEEYLKITSQLKAKEEYADKKEYNKAFNEKAKELGLLKERKAKRLDTYEYKKAKQMEEEKTLTIKKELQHTKLFAEVAFGENQYLHKEYQAKITALQNVESAQKKELHGLNNEIARIKNDDELKSKKIEELERRIKELERKEIRYAQNQTEMAQKLTNAEKTINTLTQKNKELEMDLRIGKEDFTLLLKQNREIEKKIEVQESNKKTLLKKYEAPLNANFWAFVQGKFTEFTQKTKELTQKIKELTHLNQELKTQNEELNLSSRVLQTEIKELQSTNKELQRPKTPEEIEIKKAQTQEQYQGYSR